MNDLINFTEFSFQYGQLKIDEIIELAKKENKTHAAITDFMSLAGALEFSRKCNIEGITPILGTCINVSVDNKKIGKLICYAKNFKGYQNLCKIISSNEMPFDLKTIDESHIDINKILENKEHLLFLDGFKDSLLLNLSAEEYKDFFQKNFSSIKNDFVFNVDNGSDFKIITLFEEYNFSSLALPRITTFSQNRYVLSSDEFLFKHRFHTLLNTVDSTHLSKEIESVHKYEFTSEPFDKKINKNANIVKSEREIRYYKELQQRLMSKNYLFAENDFVSLFDNIVFSKDLEIEEMHSSNFLDLIKNIWAKNLRDKLDNSVVQEYKDRLVKEYNIIKKMNFENYFIFVYEYNKKLQEAGVFTSLRGSGAASLILYMMEISAIDPVKNKLLFERFLNEDRNEEPDLDLEVSDPDLALSILKENYENSVNLMKFSSFQKYTVTIKYVIDAFLNTYKFKDKETEEKFTESVKNIINVLSESEKRYKYKKSGMLLSELLRSDISLYNLFKNDIFANQIFKKAIKTENLIFNKSISSGSVFVSKTPISNFLPIINSNSGIGKFAEITKDNKFKYIKYDILSSVALKEIKLIEELLKENKYKEINEYNDKKIFDEINKGNTTGLFQISGYIGTNLVSDIQPETFKDLMMINSLIRNGYNVKNKPIELINFIEGKNNPQGVNYKHEKIKNILEESYGVIVYEEQILQIATDFAGLSMSEADTMRSSIKKKKIENIQALKEKFIKGAKKYSLVSEEDALAVYQSLENKVGNFLFNKSHACAYSHILYIQTYYKINYPAEFLHIKQLTKKQDEYGKLAEELFKNYEISSPKINDIKDINTTINLENGEKLIHLSSSKVFSQDEIKFMKENKINSLSSFIEEMYFFKNNEHIYNIDKNSSKVNFIKNKTIELIKLGYFDSIYENNEFDFLKTRNILIENIPLIINSLEYSFNSNSIELNTDIEFNLSIKECETNEKKAFGFEISQMLLNKKKQLKKYRP